MCHSEADQALPTVEAQLQEAMSGNQNPLQYATDPRMKHLVQAKVSATKAVGEFQSIKTTIISWPDDHGYLKDTATDIQVRCDGAIRDCKAISDCLQQYSQLEAGKSFEEDFTTLHYHHESVEKDAQHVGELLREVDEAYSDEEARGIGIPEMLSRMEVLEKYLRELGEGFGGVEIGCWRPGVSDADGGAGGVCWGVTGGCWEAEGVCG